MRRFIPIAVAGIALVLAAPASTATSTVQIKSTGFVPATVTINQGDSVTWTNTDTKDHQVVSNGGAFASAILNPGKTYTHAFAGGGTYRYHDGLHPTLKGTITVDGKTHMLPQPFLVIATQNPVEHHGTYPLPESQLDRFLMRIKMGYPSHETEREILRRRAFDNPIETLQPVADVAEVLAMQEAVTHVKVDASLHDYALEIVNRTRNSDQLALGVSPRGTLMLQRAAQARAFLEGRDYCVPDDFKQLAVAVFAHRVVASSRHASLQKKSETTEAALREIIDSVRVPV